MHDFKVAVDVVLQIHDTYKKLFGKVYILIKLTKILPSKKV